MHKPGKPKKKVAGNKVPGLVQRGIAKRRFGPFGKLVGVKQKPAKEKPATLKDLERGAAEMRRLSAEAGRHGTLIGSLARTNTQLAAIKKRIRADQQIIDGAKAKINEIVQQARGAREKLPPKKATVVIKKLALQLAGLRMQVLRANAGLEVYRARESKLIKKLRARSKAKKALEKKLGLNE